jgi:hypothetical protein
MMARGRHGPNMLAATSTRDPRDHCAQSRQVLVLLVADPVLRCLRHRCHGLAEKSRQGRQDQAQEPQGRDYFLRQRLFEDHLGGDEGQVKEAGWTIHRR